jgi:hypothetical protein
MPKPKPASKTYDRLDLTPQQRQLLELRRKLSAPETRFLEKLELWESIVALEESMPQADARMIGRLVATEA